MTQKPAAPNRPIRVLLNNAAVASPPRTEARGVRRPGAQHPREDRHHPAAGLNPEEHGQFLVSQADVFSGWWGPKLPLRDRKVLTRTRNDPPCELVFHTHLAKLRVRNVYTAVSPMIARLTEKSVLRLRGKTSRGNAYADIAVGPAVYLSKKSSPGPVFV